MSDVTVSFGAKDDGLKDAIAGAEKGIGKMISAFSGLAVAAVGIAAVKSAFDAFKGFADYAGGVADLAAQTGLTSEATMVWSQALKNAGQDASALGPLMNRLQKAMSGVNEDGMVTNKAFETLGINIETLRGLSPDKQLQTVSEAIASINDPAQRAAAAMELFGKSGGKSLAVFTDSSALSTAREQLGELATNLGTSIASLDKLSDAINAAGENKGMQFLAGFAKGFAGDIDEAANSINRIDLSEAGTWAGEIAKKLKEASDYARIILNTPTPKVPEMIGFLSPASQAAMQEMDAAFLKKQAEDIASGKDPLAGKRQEKPAATVSKMNEELGSSLDLMTDFSKLSETTLSLQNEFDASLSGAADQMAVMIESQNSLNAAKEKEAEAAQKAADIEAGKLADLKAQTLERLNAAKSQLQTIAGADVPSVGERGTRARAAKKALQLEQKAAEAEAFGNTEKANGFREKAAKAREKAFGKEGDKVGTLEKTVQTIEKTLSELAKKLPTPALAP